MQTSYSEKTLSFLTRVQGIFDFKVSTRDQIFGFLLLLYFFCSLCTYTTESKYFNYLTIIFGLVAFIHELFHIENQDLIFYWLFSLIIFGFLSSFFFYDKGSVATATLSIIKYFLINIGMAFVLLRRPVQWQAMYAIFLLLCVYLFFMAFRGEDPDNILPKASQNYISVLLIMTTVLLYISLERAEKRITIIPALLTLILCLWAMGRSGIISSAILLLGVAFMKRYDTRNRLYLKILLFAVILLILTGVLETLFVEGNYLIRFAHKGLESSARESILSYYVNQLDLSSLLFGFDPYRDNFLRSFLFNYHCSFLNLHSLIGFAAFPMIIFLLLSLCKSFIYNRLYSIFIIVILFRAFTDEVLFFRNFDFILYYLSISMWIRVASTSRGKIYRLNMVPT